MKTETAKTMVDELMAVADQFTRIHQKMTCLVTLTPEQREETRGRRLGMRKLHLLRNRVALAAANPGQLPATFDLPSLEQDTAITVALFDTLRVLDKIRDSVNDTLVVVGGPAVLKATEANSHMKLVSVSAQRLAPTERRKNGRLPVTSPAVVGPATTGEPSTPVPLPPPVTPFNPTSAAA